jgi:hypothetical protein
VRRARDATHCLCWWIRRWWKAIKRMRYNHSTSDLYGGEILPFDKLSICQDILLIFKIRNGLIKHTFVLTLLLDVHHHGTRNRSRGDFYVHTSRNNQFNDNLWFFFFFVIINETLQNWNSRNVPELLCSTVYVNWIKNKTNYIYVQFYLFYKKKIHRQLDDNVFRQHKIYKSFSYLFLNGI